jgi:phosphoribosylanthranilate isomerase
MRPRVKICGITNLRDALCAVEAGADYLGFIFYPKSPRYIAPDRAASIIHQLPDRVTPVGVFVNDSREVINKVIAGCGIRLIQLSGDESPDDCRNYPVNVWKAFRIRDPGNVRRTADFQLDAALLDGARDAEYGGSGERADLSVAGAMKSFHRLVLAGGLSPENIVDAISSVDPFAVDVNSGVEHAPGIKDHTKIFELFRQVNLA